MPLTSPSKNTAARRALRPLWHTLAAVAIGCGLFAAFACAVLFVVLNFGAP